MFWILRRTGAANFFNSLNNNCSTSKGNNNNHTQDKYVKRPPRKAYGRLSADSDDAASMKHQIDDPFDDIDNFEMIATRHGAISNGNVATRMTLVNGCTHAANDVGGVNGGGGGGVGTGRGRINDNGAGECADCSCLGNGNCNSTDCQGNYVDGESCDLDLASLCGTNVPGGNLKSSTSQHRQKEVNENTINRLQAMAMSDDDDYDESLTCNVCDRAFHCHRQLASHQQKKRHFGCSGCDSLFPSLMLLEHHKEEFEHWSDDEMGRRICCRRNRGDDYFTDTDSFTSEAESEDLERLL